MKGTVPRCRPSTPALCPSLMWVPTSLPTCPQALRVNGLEQLCNNLASERLQLLSIQMLLAQEEEVRHGRAGGHPAVPWNRGHPW